MMIDPAFYGIIHQCQNLVDLALAIAEGANCSQKQHEAAKPFLQDATRALDSSINTFQHIRQLQRKSLLMP